MTGILRKSVILREPARSVRRPRGRYRGEAVFAVAVTLCWFLVACGDASGPGAAPPITIGPPARVALLTVPPSAPVATDLQLVARVTDSSGNHVPRAAVSWRVINGGGSIAPDVTVADDSGVVATTYHLSQVAGQLRVRATLATNATQDFDIKALPGPLSELLPDYTDLSLRVGSSFSGTVKAVDTYGNAVPGIGLTARAGDIEYTSLQTPPLSPLTQTTDSSGNATFSGVVGSLPGLQTFSVDGPNGFVIPGPINAWFRVRAFADQGYIYSISATGTMTMQLSVARTLAIVVAAIGRDGMPATNVPVSFALAPGNGSLDANGSTSLTGLTDKYSGFVSVVWRPPPTVGTYALTANTPPPNDGGGPLVFTLKVVP